MAAGDANLTEALNVLNTTHSFLSNGIIKGQYSLWIGAMFSADIAPSLQDLLKELITEIHSRSDIANSNCPYKRCLDRILNYAAIPISNVTQPPPIWPEFNEITHALTTHYSEVLGEDISTPGGGCTLAWDILKLDQKYSDITLVPDAEHMFLAYMVHEGLFEDVITTNWDPLIERALTETAPGGRPIAHVVACNDEIDGTRSGKFDLIKIHGCAQKMSKEPDKYKPFMVATKEHIREWSVSPKAEPFRNLVTSYVRSKPSLFIGLSGQDWNIQSTFYAAKLFRDLPFSPGNHRAVFTVSEIGPAQRDVLKCIYGTDVYRDNADTIEANARLPLYAKPLMGALYIFTLKNKLTAILNNCSEDLSGWRKQFICDKIELALGYVISHYDSIPDFRDRWRTLCKDCLAYLARIISFYRDNKLPNCKEYKALYNGNLQKISRDQNLPDIGLHWLLMVIAVLIEGHEKRKWALSLSLDSAGHNAQFQLEKAGRRLNVFIVNKIDVSKIKLDKVGAIDMKLEEKYVIIYPKVFKDVVSSPKRMLPGGIKPKGPLEIGFRDLEGISSSPDELLDALELELNTRW